MFICGMFVIIWKWLGLYGKNRILCMVVSSPSSYPGGMSFWSHSRGQLSWFYGFWQSFHTESTVVPVTHNCFRTNSSLSFQQLLCNLWSKGKVSAYLRATLWRQMGKWRYSSMHFLTWEVVGSELSPLEL
jgi:hypothetical protein